MARRKRARHRARYTNRGLTIHSSWVCPTCEEDVAEHPGRTINLKFQMCSACVQNIRRHIWRILTEPDYLAYWQHHVAKKVNRLQVIKDERRNKAWHPQHHDIAA